MLSNVLAVKQLTGRRVASTLAAFALVTGVVMVPRSTPAASAASPMSTCPEGTVEVVFGGFSPVPENVRPMAGGLLCQAVFTSSGTFSTPANVESADVVVVGGGGGGGLGGIINGEVLAGGGGGGGQVALFEGVPVSGDISVTVGAGGTGGADPCDPTCQTTGVDGLDGSGSEFGSDGTYVAAGGDGGLGGVSIAGAPFVASGTGGASPGAPLSVPVDAISTISSGGVGGAPDGDMVGPASDIYASGGGGGAGAGEAGADGTSTSCITVDGGPLCEVYGGDGGEGFLPEGGFFDLSYWDFFDWTWARDQFGQNADVSTYGFGPGGGGSVGALLVYDIGTGRYVTPYGPGLGMSLDNGGPVNFGNGSGSQLFASNVLGYTPYIGIEASAGRACGWNRCNFGFNDTFGGGGGGGTGNSSLTTEDPLDYGVAGADGGDGIVIVLFELPVDNDGDGFLSNVDCNDDAATINPDATEVLGNGLDDDCNVETPLASSADFTCEAAPFGTGMTYEGRRIDLSEIDVVLVDAVVGSSYTFTSATAVGGPASPDGILVVPDPIGTSPWVSTLTVGDTTGISVGDAVAASADEGSLGHGNSTVVSAVIDGTTLEITSTGSIEPTAGRLLDIRFGQAVDAKLTVSAIDTRIGNLRGDDQPWSSFFYGIGHKYINSKYTALGYSGAISNVVEVTPGEWTFDVTGVVVDQPGTEDPGVLDIVVGEQIAFGETYGTFLGWFGKYVVSGVDGDTLHMTATGGIAPTELPFVEFAPLTSVEYLLEFFETGTTTPIELDGVSLTGLDIGRHRFAEFPSPARITLPTVSDVEVLTNADDATVEAGSYRFWSAAQTDWATNEPDHWAEVGYDAISSLTFRIGQMMGGAFNMDVDLSSANSANTEVFACGPPVDDDGDGFPVGSDCDDTRPTVYPGATEVELNGLDDDCDPLTPSLDRNDFTCVASEVAPAALPANEYRTLNFSKPEDIGEPAAAGDSFRYDQVGAIGGPSFDSGYVLSVSGSNPSWSAVLSVTDTSGLTVGDAVIAVKDDGRIGNGGVYTITAIDGNGTDFTISAEGGSTPVIGALGEIRTGARVDAVVTVVSVDSIEMQKVDDYSSTGTSNRRLDVEHDFRSGISDGSVENISGSGPWTATITGLTSTEGLVVGRQFTAEPASGSIGDAGVYVIDSITADSITFTATGGEAPLTGTVEDITTWGVTEYRIDFVEAGTTTPVELEGVALSLQDVDGTQFAEFLYPTEFLVSSDTRLELLSNDDFDEVPDGWVRGWATPSSDSSDERHWVEAHYALTSSISVRLGQLDDADADYNLLFGGLGLGDPVTCTVLMTEEVETTTTYTGDSGRILEGTSMTLSATVDPAECTTPAVTFELTYPDGSTETVTDPLDTTGFEGGDYQITANYAGDGTCLPSEDTADFYIPFTTTTTYTGGTGVVTVGTLVQLSATVAPDSCSSPAVTYTIIYPDGTEHEATSPLSTTGFAPGIYEIVTDYAGDGEGCLPSEDAALLVIASPGDSTTGGGIYHADSDISGSPRVHFGFTVQRTVKTDKRTGVTEEIQRGQMLWMNNNQWRLKASMYSRRVTSGGITTGDTPVFGTNPCPAGVGVTGSNPKCGVIVGGGWLERWNPDTLEWERATDLGRNGWVQFSATIYDGGSVKVCKGKTCSIVNVADWFGMSMAGIRTTDDVPVTAPIEVRKQQNGAIVIRV